MTEVTSHKKNKGCLRLELLKAFGADFQQGIRDPLFFAGENGKAIIYPVGHHIAIRDIFVRDDLRKNDIMFIYNDSDVYKITSMNISRDYSLLLVCEKKEKSCAISVYNLSKLNFKSIASYKPKRKVISTIYSEFKYASFSIDGNYIGAIGVEREDKGNEVNLHGVIWDVQIFQTYKDDNYKPKCVISLPNGVTKITIENKLICTSGVNHLTFWYIYENSIKEFKTQIKDLHSNKNYVDHEWLQLKIPTLAAITSDRDLFILEGVNDSNAKGLSKKGANNDEDDIHTNIRVEKFILKYHIPNCFGSESIDPCIVKSFSKGIVIGSTRGHLLFIERRTGSDAAYYPIRYTKREKPACVQGITFCKGEEYMAVSYNSNEIASINIKGIFDNLRSKDFKLKMNLVCDGFHQGPITSMDVALQRPIIVTTSNTDKTVRVWNYLTGHCEYCKIILTEKEKNEEREMDILSVAIHPNGYYIAISDKEMIRFFHLCYKELRFYNTDSTYNENAKDECHLLKFSNGGHLLAAVNGKQMYIIRSYSRETLKAFDNHHIGKITNIFFHMEDHFVYSIGNGGIIIEYNLFTFTIDRIVNRNYNYIGGTFSILNPNQFCVAACGYEQGPSITEVVCTETEKQDTNEIQRTNEIYFTKADKNLTSMCNIKSKKFDIFSYACGSEDGYIGLYPQLCFQYTKGDTIYPWKTIRSHRGIINSIAYSRDTNLLFSSGDDGNLFVYYVHELPDGDNLSADDNKFNLNQVISILDEGLGDNVLYPLNSIFLKELEIQRKNNLIDEYKNKELKLINENSSKIREIESTLNKQRENEAKELNDKIAGIQLSKEGTIEHYKDRIKFIETEHQRTLETKEKEYTDRIEQMSNTIHDLNSKIYSLKAEHAVDLKNKEEGYEKKFKEIEIELENKFEEIKNNNDKLSYELKSQKKLEEYKFFHLDKEHEQEINYKNQKFENIIAKMEREKVISHNEIKALNEQKEKFKEEINKCEREIKNKNDDIKRHLETIQALRKANEMKEEEKVELIRKLKESEDSLQEKSKLAGFTSKLKNEIYIKNVDITSKFNKQQIENTELKEMGKNIEKELDENIHILQNKEKEIKKNQLLLDEYKEKYERERQNAKLIEKDFDNLLQKIYESFQTNDKNIIIKELKKIYNLYLTGDIAQKVDSSRLNVNIREELTKQIDFLQKGILNLTDIKNRREKNQNAAIAKKSGENATLIKQLNQKEKDLQSLKSRNEQLKKEHDEMEKKYNQLLRAEKLKMRNMENNKEMKMAQTAMEFRKGLPKLAKENDFLASTIYKMKDFEDDETREKKSWKDGKLYKGNALSLAYDVRNEPYRTSEIKKILDEKAKIIKHQSIEIEMLKNSLANSNKREGKGSTTAYIGGFRGSSVGNI